MIKGDIDLTENLDFRKDKQLPAVQYKNDPRIIPSKEVPKQNSESFFNVYYSINLNYDYNSNTWISSTGSGEYVYLDLGNEWIENDINSTLYYYDNSNTISLTYSTSDSRITRYSLNLYREYNKLHKLEGKILNAAEKLFGKKKRKFFYNIHKDAYLGLRKEPNYKNAKPFDTSHRKNKTRTLLGNSLNSTWSNYIEYLYSNKYEVYDLSAKEKLNYLFGVKKSNSKTIESDRYDYNKSKYDNIPWIKELKIRNKNAYEYYIEELEGIEKDYSRFLTDMHWLRIHD